MTNNISTSATHDMTTTSKYRIRGWHYDQAFQRDHLAQGKMIGIDAETSNICDADCEYCYTVLDHIEDIGDLNFHNKTLPGELTIEERKNVIDQAAELGALTYSIVGAGEPFLDRHLLTQLEYASSKGMIPVVYSNGSVLGSGTKKAQEIAHRLYDMGASVMIKWHSKNNELHDSILRKKILESKKIKL